MHGEKINITEIVLEKKVTSGCWCEEQCTALSS